MVDTQFNAKVHILKSDNGGEYIDREFQSYLDDHGTSNKKNASKSLKKIDG